MADRLFVLITGATKGLGRAMTDEFVRLGHVVIGCGRSRKAIEQLRKQHGPTHDFYMVDVASDEEVKSWASVVTTSHGAPDLLLNNAAIINNNARVWEVPAREFSDVIDINIKGVANVIRHFVPEMVKRRRGIIVNFTSTWGRTAEAEVAPYCASKWALEGLTQALAQELPSGMAAVSFNPGIINTAMLQSCFGPSAASYPDPADWVKTAVPFLLRLSATDNGKQLGPAA
jgi:NAD(P)-dependent dehydrogenase (short-subunit alcohol dehydrogenase family)